MEERHLEEPTDWEALLAGEGMPDELGEDSGAAALREKTGETEADDNETAVRHALQEYMVSRAEARHGLHTQAAQEIIANLGLQPGDVEITDADIKEVEDEVAAAKKMLAGEVERLQEQGAALRPEQLEPRLMRKARTAFPDMSEVALEILVSQAAGTEENHIHLRR
jgi:hypothetical protein